MAGFKTHITTSSVLGGMYGSGAYLGFGFDFPTCALASVLCGVSGMLPDLDSDSGKPRRESVAFAAACVPVMLEPRARALEMPPELMVLCGAAIYLGIRFGLQWFLEKCTDHRGMWHSVPTMLIFGELTFLLCYSVDVRDRYLLATGTMLGFASHLILDEIWAVESQRGQIRFKKSFGTAIKLWGDSNWANFSTYAKLIVLTYILIQDPNWMQQLPSRELNYQQMAGKIEERFAPQIEKGREALSRLREIDTTQGSSTASAVMDRMRQLPGQLEQRWNESRGTATESLTDQVAGAVADRVTDAAMDAVPQEASQGLPSREEVSQRLKSRFRSLFDDSSGNTQPSHLVPVHEPTTPTNSPDAGGWNPYRPSAFLPRPGER
jgi:hypothetical protein